MRQNGKTVLEAESVKFLKNPLNFLKKFSKETDKHAFLRKFTFFSLISVCAVTLYFCIYIIFRIIAGQFLQPKRAVYAACLLTVAVETAFLYPLFVQTEKRADIQTALSELESGDWRRRVEALKILYRLGKAPGNFRNREKMMKSPHMPERYWMAKIAGKSHLPGTYEDIVILLDDDHSSVVYNAYKSLGMLKDKRGIAEIEKRIAKSDNWYVQVYAYKALRKLGWRQTGPKPK